MGQIHLTDLKNTHENRSVASGDQKFEDFGIQSEGEWPAQSGCIQPACSAYPPAKMVRLRYGLSDSSSHNCLEDFFTLSGSSPRERGTHFLYFFENIRFSKNKKFYRFFTTVFHYFPAPLLA